MILPTVLREIAGNYLIITLSATGLAKAQQWRNTSAGDRHLIRRRGSTRRPPREQAVSPNNWLNDGRPIHRIRCLQARSGCQNREGFP